MSQGSLTVVLCYVLLIKSSEEDNNMNILNTTTRLTGRATGASVRTMGTIINLISAKATPRLNAIAKEFIAGYEGQQTKFTVEQWQQLQELQDMNKVSPKQMELDV
jgi:hypothetical protein